jgi:hypothetical protein
MLDEETPRYLSERTGKHRCIRCLADTPDEQYFANDHLCETCAAEEEQQQEKPQSSTTG